MERIVFRCVLKPGALRHKMIRGMPAYTYQSEVFDDAARTIAALDNPFATNTVAIGRQQRDAAKKARVNI